MLVDGGATLTRLCSGSNPQLASFAIGDFTEIQRLLSFSFSFLFFSLPPLRDFSSRRCLARRLARAPSGDPGMQVAASFVATVVEGARPPRAEPELSRNRSQAAAAARRPA